MTEIQDEEIHSPDRHLDISVVVCAFNEEEYIRAALESVFRQDTRRSWELVVVDDGSTDGTRAEVAAAVAGGHDDVQWTYVRIAHAGLSVARNAGIEVAGGRVVAYLDADAVADSGWLDHLADAFDDGKIVGAGGAIEILNEDNAFARFIDCFHHRRAYEVARGRVPIVGANMAFRRDVLRSVGGFRGTFKSRGDDDSVRHEVEALGELAFVPAAVVLHTRPGSWSEWLSERRANGRARVLLDQYLDARSRGRGAWRSHVAAGRVRTAYPVVLILGLLTLAASPVVGGVLVGTALLAGLARSLVYFGRGLPGASDCARKQRLPRAGYFLRAAAVSLASTVANDVSYALAVWGGRSPDWESISSKPQIEEIAKDESSLRAGDRPS